MYQIKIKLKSVSPYIQNNPVELIDVVKNAATKTRIGKAVQDPEKTGYKNAKGFYIPARQIKGMLFAAGKKIKLGKASIANYIKACVFCDSLEIQMLRQGKPIKEKDFVYNDPVIRKDGQMVFNPRVAFNTWEVEFTLNVTEENIPKEKILEVIAYGGLYVGIGARRPEYGRFMIY